MPLRVFCLVILLLGIPGMLVHSQLIPTGRIRPGMFSFYTNQSNLLILLYQLLLLIGTFFPRSGFFRFLAGSGMALSMTLCIYVTHLIYHFVLVPESKRSGKGFEDGKIGFGNLCVHYLIPWLTVLEWIFCADKTRLSFIDALLWLLIPLAYFIYAMLRARTGRPIGHTRLLYPYPFLNLPELGPKRFWLGVAGLMVLFFVLGCLMVLLGQLLV